MIDYKELYFKLFEGTNEAFGDFLELKFMAEEGLVKLSKIQGECEEIAFIDHVERFDLEVEDDNTNLS